MKFSRLLSLVFVITIVPAFSFSQQENAQQAEQKQTATAEKKVVRPANLTFHQSMTENVTGVTDEQKTQIGELQKAAGVKHKEIFTAAGITKAMEKKRQQLYQTLPVELKGKELADRVNQGSGFSEKQVKAHQQANEVWRVFRFDSMKVLTEGQRDSMTDWIQKDYKKSLGIEAEEKAKQENSSKETGTTESSK